MEHLNKKLNNYIKNEDNKISLRRIVNNEKDYRLLENWYKEEDIYSHFEQRILNYDEIVKKYYPRTLKNAKIPVYMIEYENNPVGIIQYQKVTKENKELYKIDIDNSYELDIFIGNTTLYNKGLGRISVSLMVDYLFDKKEATLIVMCPLKDNVNAIRCYEHAGFKIEREFITNDTAGNIMTYYLMELRNN